MVPRTHTLEQTLQECREMILPTAYFAPARWYKVFVNEPCQIEVCESFPKQTYRNRCTIMSPDGPVTLSVPVCHVESKQLTRDIQISYQQHWQHQHKIALLSAYKRTPYFDYYQDYIMPLYDNRFKYLKDLNDACHSVVWSLMQNQRPQLPQTLPATDDWQQQDLEQFWGDGSSILDLLMQYGPQTTLYLQQI